MSMMRRGKTGAKGRAAPLHGRKRKIRKNRDDPATRRDRPCSLARILLALCAASRKRTHGGGWREYAAPGGSRLTPCQAAGTASRKRTKKAAGFRRFDTARPAAVTIDPICDLGAFM